MDIGSVMRNYSASSVQSTHSVRRSDSSLPPPGNASPASAADGGASQVQVSGPGQLLRQLSDLQQSDPAKFKEVAQQISESFSAAAQNASGEDAKRLTGLADKLAQAAQSGDMSAFRPPPRNESSAAGSEGAQSTQRGYARHSAGPRQHAVPSQAMQDAFSSALSILSNATAA